MKTNIQDFLHACAAELAKHEGLRLDDAQFRGIWIEASVQFEEITHSEIVGTKLFGTPVPVFQTSIGPFDFIYSSFCSRVASNWLDHVNKLKAGQRIKLVAQVDRENPLPVVEGLRFKGNGRCILVSLKNAMPLEAFESQHSLYPESSYLNKNTSSIDRKFNKEQSFHPVPIEWFCESEGKSKITSAEIAKVSEFVVDGFWKEVKLQLFKLDKKVQGISLVFSGIDGQLECVLPQLNGEIAIISIAFGDVELSDTIDSLPNLRLKMAQLITRPLNGGFGGDVLDLLSKNQCNEIPIDVDLCEQFVFRWGKQVEGVN